MRISYLFTTVLLMCLTESAVAGERQFENRYVTVTKSRISRNHPLALHRHQHGRALAVFKGGTLELVDAAGATVKRLELEAGKAYWLDADPPNVLHGDVNRGKKPIEVMVIEMK